MSISDQTTAHHQAFGCRTLIRPGRPRPSLTPKVT